MPDINDLRQRQRLPLGAKEEPEDESFGEWIKTGLVDNLNPVYRCSICGFEFADSDYDHHFCYKFCPNCGKKMGWR